MTTKLKQAGRALLAHWDTPAWKQQKPTADLMAGLRNALTEQDQIRDATKIVECRHCDLLEAAKRVIGCHPYRDEPHRRVILESDVMALEAAIAKATGETA